MFSVLGTLMASPLPEAVRKKREAESRQLAGQLVSPLYPKVNIGQRKQSPIPRLRFTCYRLIR